MEMEWYKTSAKKGHAREKTNIARLEEQGDRVKSDECLGIGHIFFNHTNIEPRQLNIITNSNRFFIIETKTRREGTEPISSV